MELHNYTSGLSIKSWAEDDKPREKLQNKGRHVLSDAELIAILIGSGTRKISAVELSKNILSSTSNDLHALGKLSVEDLMKFKGIGEAKAITIVAALELGRRRKAAEREERIIIRSSNDAYQIFSPKMIDLPHEEFWIMSLNRANKVMGLHNISRGGVSGTIADSKIIYKTALNDLASSIILCHNHPSGNIRPSESDLQLTKKLKQAGKVLDISVLDHLIIGDERYYSFADEGML
ncbi:MAG: hypothetical protein CL843_05725 [Crocinitomicaceae bacterium]|nr:hypothetical protein [Crocinitomicaceae bacterium]